MSVIFTNILGVEYSVNYTTILDLSWKELKEIPHGVFELVNLKILDLSHNKLTEISLNINKLVNLRVLHLSYNELTELNEISSLMSLEILELNHNELTAIPNINKSVNLKYLYLDYNELTSIPQEFCEMKNLIHVDLSNNCIVDEESIKLFENMDIEYKRMSNQKQQSIKMLMLPMVII